MDNLFERVAVAIYETDEINQIGGSNRIPLRSCHPGHQKRIDNMAQAAIGVFNSNKHSDDYPSENLRKYGREVGLPPEIPEVYSTQNPSVKAVCAKCEQQIFYLDEHEGGCPTKTTAAKPD